MILTTSNKCSLGQALFTIILPLAAHITEQTSNKLSCQILMEMNGVCGVTHLTSVEYAVMVLLQSFRRTPSKHLLPALKKREAFSGFYCRMHYFSQPFKAH